MAPNLYYLSKTDPIGASLSRSSINAAVSAANLMPSVFDYSLNAGLYLLKDGQREEALIYFQSIANDVHNVKRAELGERIIEAVNNNATYEEVIAIMESKPED